MNLAQATERLVSDACADLLASIGFTAGTRPQADITRVLAHPRDYAAGIIDFAGDAMKGKVVLLAPFDFFAASRARAEGAGALSSRSAADWIRVRDWTMELSNQLLGRIKNQLCTIGVVVEAGLPRAVSDHALIVTVRERKGAHRVFAAGRHEVLVWFEADMNEAGRRSTSIAPVKEGDLITF
jgi:hypothetical protein